MTKEEILAYLKTQKERFQKLYSVNKIGVFGSYARDEATKDSDIDIVVDLNKTTMFGLVAIKEDIEEYFHTKVDIVQLRDRMNTLLKQRIEKEAIYVWSRDNYKFIWKDFGRYSSKITILYEIPNQNPKQM